MVLTGARARLSLDGVALMYALNASYGEQIQLDPVEPLDQFDVAEFVPTAYRCTFTAQIVRVITASVKLHNGLTIFPTLEKILDAAEMTATIEDRVTGRVVANIERVRASRYQIAVGARGIVLTDVEFTAVRIRDESEIV